MIRKYALALMAGMGAVSSLGAAEFMFSPVSSSVGSFSASSNLYFAVASSGTNFMCVGSNSIAPLAVTTNALASGGYLFAPSGWVPTVAAAKPYYLNSVTYGTAGGTGGFMAAGVSNAVFFFQGTNGTGSWAPPTNAVFGNSVDAQGLSYNPASGNFVLALAYDQADWSPYTTYSSVTKSFWTNSTLVAGSPLESFRGVASMGGNNLAMCGIRGDIRLSSNGGVTWNTNREINLNAGDFYGIASDGANTLVCVGQSNVLVSINGGTTWSTNCPTGAGGTNYYSAAYTGTNDNNFMIVGTGGNLWIATNTATIVSPGAWSSLAVAGVTKDLRGVAVASSGPFQGVAMAAGVNGTILVGGTEPQPPTNSVTLLVITNLLSNPTNNYNYFTATNVVDNTHPAGSMTVDWFATSSAGDLLQAASTNYTPTNVVGGMQTYWALARDIRTGLTNPILSPYTAVIIPPPPASVMPPLTNVLTTNNPVWVQVYTNGNNPYSDFVVDWYLDSAATLIITNGTETNSGPLFYHTATNRVSGVYTIYARTVATNATHEESASSTAVTFVVIPPAPSTPMGATNWAFATGVTNGGNPALSVTVLTNADNLAGEIVADWSTNQSASGIVLSNSLTYTPPNTNAGSYVYYARSRDTASGQVSTNWTAATFVVFNLPAAPTNADGLTYATTNILTAPLQLNATLTSSVPTLPYLPGGYTVTVDWFTSSNAAYNAAYNAPTNASSGTNNPDANWVTGGGAVRATNSLTFIPTNLLSGTYTYWARSRVVNPGFPNPNGLSSALTAFTVVELPPRPPGALGGLTDLTNVLTIPGTNMPLWVNVLTNGGNPPANFVVNWYLNATGSNGLSFLNDGTETNLANRFYHTPTNAVLCGTYTNWAETMATNTTPAGVTIVSTNRTPVMFTIIPPAPTNAVVVYTNVLTPSAFVCNPVWVQLLVNADNPATNFVVDWYADSLAADPIPNAGSETNLSNAFFHTPTNQVSGSYTIYAETVATNTSPENVPVVSTNLTPVTFVVIPPAPSNPLGATNWAYAAGVPNAGNPALSVSVLTSADSPSGLITADWYTSSNALVQVTNNSLSYVPTDNTPGTYTYWAQSRYTNSTTLVSQVSTNLTAVTFVVFALPAAPTNADGLTYATTNLLTYPVQNNLTLTSSITALPNLPIGYTVTVDWYADYGTNLAYTGTNNTDSTWLTGGGVLVATNMLTFIPTNLLSGTYNYWARARVLNPGFPNTNGLSAALTEFTVVELPPAPPSALGGLATLTNVLTIPGTNMPLWVNVLTNGGNSYSNFVVNWYLNATGSNGLSFLNDGTETNLANRFYHTPTNAVLCGTYTNWAETMATNTSPAGVAIVSTNRTPVIFTIIPPAPTNAVVVYTNVLTSSAFVCNPVWVQLLVNADNPATNFVVDWYADSLAADPIPNAGTETNLSNEFFHTPTNQVSGAYTIYAETVATNTSPENVPVVSTNLTPVTFVVIPPAPSNPLGATNWAASVTVPNTYAPSVSVSVLVNGDNPTGWITADWYTSSNALVQVTNSSLSYVPTNSTAGTYTYWAQARDTNSGLVSTNLTAVTFVVFDLPTAPTNAAGLTYATTNLLTYPLQTNLTLTSSVAALPLLPGGYAVTVDWFTDSNGVYTASTGTNNADPNWLTGGGVTNAVGVTTYIPTNLLSGTFNYWARSRVVNPGFPNTNGLSSTLTEFTVVLLPPAPVSYGGGLTNVLTSPQTNAPIWVNVLTNGGNSCSNFVVYWFDANGVSLTNGTETNLSNSFYHTPTNRVSGLYTNWAETVATNTSPEGTYLVSTNLTPVTFALIPPAPLTATGATNELLSVNPPLSVSVLTNADNPAGWVTADWYTSSNGLVQLTNSSLTYVPTNTAPGYYVYWTQARDTNTSLVSTNWTAVTFVLDSATPQISPFTTNGVGVVSWYGNLILQATTNLVPPIIWLDEVTGTVDSGDAYNSWSWTNSATPIQFFRLKSE